MEERKRLGEILKEMGVVDEEKIQKALELKEKDSLLLGEALVRLGMISQEQMGWALAQQYQLPYIRIEPEKMDLQVARLIPRDFALRHNLLPLYRIGDEMAIVLSDPRLIPKVEQLKKLLKPLASLSFSFSLGEEKEIQGFLQSIWGESEKKIEPSAEENVFTSDPSGGSLLDHLLQKGISKKSTLLYLDFFPEGLNVFCQAEKKIEKIFQSNEEWAEILKNLLRQEGGEDGFFARQISGKEIAYQVFFATSQNQTTAILRTQEKPSPALPGGMETLLSSLTQIPSGLVLLTGSPQEGENFSLALLQQFLHQGKRVAAWVPHRFYDAPGIFWLDHKKKLNQIEILHPQVVYMDLSFERRTFSLALHLALKGYPIFLGAYFPTMAHLLASQWIRLRQQFLFRSVFQRAVEIQNFHLLCPHCKKEIFFREKRLPFYASSGCSECKGSGFLKKELVTGEIFPSESLFLYEKKTQEDQKKFLEEYKKISTVYGRAEELIRSGKISFAEANLLWLPSGLE